MTMTSSNIVCLTEDNFQVEVLNEKLPVLVDFWAPWCQPCKSMTPILQRIAATYDTRVKVGKLDVDACPVIADRFDIRAVPTLVFWRKGRPSNRIAGVTTYKVLTNAIDYWLKHVARHP